MLTYHTLSEFFAAADAAHCAPGELACRQEAEESGKSFEDVWERMKNMIPIFRQSIQEGLSDTAKSSSGLVGGDANRLFQGKMRFLSPVCQRAAAKASENGSCLLAKTAKDGMTVSIYAKEWRAEF